MEPPVEPPRAVLLEKTSSKPPATVMISQHGLTQGREAIDIALGPPRATASPAVNIVGPRGGAGAAAAASASSYGSVPASPGNEILTFMAKGPQPPGTVLYQVRGRDTMRSLAVKFTMTESVLCALNKIVCRSVFPGQMIYVRDINSQDYTGAMTESVEALRLTSDEIGDLATVITKGTQSDAAQTADDEVMRAHDMVAVPGLSSAIVDNFVNETMAVLKVLYVTDGKGMVPGVLEANVDYVRFTPDPGMIVEEWGSAEYTLHFEHLDLLQPITQSNVPDLSDSMTSIGPGGAHHHSPTRQALEERQVRGNTFVSPATESSAAADQLPKTEPTSILVDDVPQYLQLRVRLVYGQEPTPTTTASYWFAVMPAWIDPLFELLWKHSELAAKESWELVTPGSFPGDGSGIGEDFNFDAMYAQGKKEDSFSIAGKLLSESELIDTESMAQLHSFLPSRQQYADWVLEYSSYEDGMSLSAMYRKLAGKTGPCITIVRDTQRHVFGAYTTETWRSGKDYYGGGECFLFKLKPKFRTYLWAAKNHYFMMSDDKSMMIGGGSGVAGLWLDDDFMHGSSGPTQTFNNDGLASSPDFKIDGLEVWSFVEQEF